MPGFRNSALKPASPFAPAPGKRRRRWPSGWRPRPRGLKLAQDEMKNPYKPGRDGRRYALFWVWEASKCRRCGEVRTTRRYLHLFVAGKKSGGGWWVRSKRVKPVQPKPVSKSPFGLHKGQKGRFYFPGHIQAPEHNRPADIKCQCPTLRLPKGLNISIRID